MRSPISDNHIDLLSVVPAPKVSENNVFVRTLYPYVSGFPEKIDKSNPPNV